MKQFDRHDTRAIIYGNTFYLLICSNIVRYIIKILPESGGRTCISKKERNTHGKYIPSSNLSK